jgi:flagellar motor component MotA
MTHDEFIKRYYEISERALKFLIKSKREGFLALEEEMDYEKQDDRDIFEYGMRLVIDGTDAAITEKLLSNIIK